MSVVAERRGMRVEHVEGGIRYTLPPRFAVFPIISESICLAAWPFAMTALVRAVFAGDPKISLFIRVGQLLICTAFGLVAFYDLLSRRAGKELVTLSPGMLRIQWRVPGIEVVGEYATHEIRNLHVARVAWGCFRRRPWGAFDGGPIVFKYGWKTVRFGAGLNETEAHAVVRELERHGL